MNDEGGNGRMNGRGAALQWSVAVAALVGDAGKETGRVCSKDLSRTSHVV